MPRKPKTSGMKGGLLKRGKFYHYKHRDEHNRQRFISTRCETKEEAETWVEARFKKPERQKILAESLGQSLPTPILFTEFVEQYFIPHSKKQHKASTQAALRFKVRQVLRTLERLRIEHLHEISSKTVLEYQNLRLKDKKVSHGAGQISAGTLKREVYCLSAICKLGVHLRYIERNPCHSLPLPNEKPKPITVITKISFEDIFIPACPEYHRSMYQFLYYTGCRKSEMTGLKWRDVDFKEKTVIFRDTKYKGRDRRFPMFDILEKILKEQAGRATKRSKPISIELFKEIPIVERVIDLNGLVFKKKDGSRWDAVHITFQRYLEEAGLPRLRIHDLRHSCVSYLADQGLPYEKVAQLLGFHSYAIYDRYRHMFEKAEKDIKVLDRAWDAE